MKVIHNSLSLATTQWDDPGPDVCGAGQALPSFQSEELDGYVELDLNAADLANLADTNEDVFEAADECLHHSCGEHSAAWTLSVEGRFATIRGKLERSRT